MIRQSRLLVTSRRRWQLRERLKRSNNRGGYHSMTGHFSPFVLQHVKPSVSFAAYFCVVSSRQFSSNVPPGKPPPLTALESLKEGDDLTEKLLARPVGSLTTEEFRKLRHAAVRLAGNNNPGNNQDPAASVAVIQRTLSLMDRLTDEVSHNPNFHWKSQALLPIYGRPWFLHLWKQLWMQQSQSPAAETEVNLPSFEEMVPKIQSYFLHNTLPQSPSAILPILDVVEATVGRKQHHHIKYPLVARKAQQIVDSLTLPPPHHPPDTVLSSRLIHFWAKAAAGENATRNNRAFRQTRVSPADDDDVDPVEKATHVFRQLQANYQKTQKPEYRPDAYVYGSMVHVLTKSGRPDAGAKGMKLLLEARDRYKIQPNKYMYGPILTALTETDIEEAKSFLKNLIEEWERDYQKNRKNKSKVVTPTPDLYSPLIAGMMTKERRDLRSALHLLQQMQDLAARYSCPEIEPSAYCYECIFEPLHEAINEHSKNYPRHDSTQTSMPLSASERNGLETAFRDLNFPTDQRSTVEEAIAILDRLCLEAARDAVRPLRGDDDATSTMTTTLSPVDLENLLTAWKASTNLSKSRNKLVSLKSMLSRVRNYLTVGLFLPNNHILDWMVDAIGATESREDAPAIAESLLKSAIDNCEGDIHSSQHPNKLPYRRVIQLWGRSGLKDAPEAAEATLRRLKDWYNESSRTDMLPDNHVFVAVINAWIRSRRPGAHLRALACIHDSWKLGIRLDRTTFLAVFRALSLAGDAGNAIELLDQIISNYQEKRTEAAVPLDAHMVSSVVTACSRAGKAKFAEDLLLQLEAKYHETGDRAYLPSTACYNALIDTFAKDGDPRRAESVLRKMIEMSSSRDDSFCKPDLTSWNTVLAGWANNKAPESVDKVRALFAELEQCSRESGGPAPPDAFSWNCILEAFWKSRSPEQYVSDGLTILISLENHPDVNPDTNSYWLCLSLLCKAGRVEDAISLLDHMCSSYVERKAWVVPTVEHMNAVVSGIIRSRDDGSIAKAQSVISKMINFGESSGLSICPNRDTYVEMIKICARRKDSAEDAEAILSQMLKLYEDRNVTELRPDVGLFNEILSAWGRSENEDAVLRVRALFEKMNGIGVAPDERSFLTAIKLERRHGRPYAMQAMFDKCLKASSHNISFEIAEALLEGWSEAGKAAHATTMLDFLLEQHNNRSFRAKPKTRHFLSVIRCWSESGRIDSADKAEKLLDMMEQFSRANGYTQQIGADIFAHIIAAHALSRRRDAGSRSERLLRRLETIFRESNDSAYQPSLAMFGNVIVAYTFARDEKAATARILQLLDEIESLGDRSWLGDGRIVFLSVMNALQSSSLPHAAACLKRLASIISNRLNQKSLTHV